MEGEGMDRIRVWVRIGRGEWWLCVINIGRGRFCYVLICTGSVLLMEKLWDGRDVDCLCTAWLMWWLCYHSAALLFLFIVIVWGVYFDGDGYGIYGVTIECVCMTDVWGCVFNKRRGCFCFVVISMRRVYWFEMLMGYDIDWVCYWHDWSPVSYNGRYRTVSCWCVRGTERSEMFMGNVVECVCIDMSGGLNHIGRGCTVLCWLYEDAIWVLERSEMLLDYDYAVECGIGMNGSWGSVSEVKVSK